MKLIDPHLEQEAYTGMFRVLDYTIEFKKYYNGNSAAHDLSLYIRKVERLTDAYVARVVIARSGIDLKKLEKQ
ncbi:MAG TPA: hypothetical protein PKI14_01290 [Fervidobacterium sp.]|nr:hypothetical protein [Fervidobacterium sp.]